MNTARGRKSFASRVYVIPKHVKGGVSTISFSGLGDGSFHELLLGLGLNQKDLKELQRKRKEELDP